MLQSRQDEVRSRFAAVANPLPGWAGPVGLALVVAIIYFLAARLSLALLSKEGVAVFWPAAGVSSGALIALGRNARWPVVAGTMVATIVANLLGDRNVWSSLAFAACNAGEALITAGLIQHYFGANFTMGRVRGVLGLMVAAIVGTTISGVAATVAYKLLHSPDAPILLTWEHWFASDAVGIITLAPLVIGIATAVREPPPHREIAEGNIALVALVVMTAIIVYLPSALGQIAVPIGLIFPLLLWLAARCRPMFASVGSFIVSLAIVWTTTFGIGQFGDATVPIEERILRAQAGILTVSFCAFILAALFAERRQHEAELTESEARLQEALTAGAVTAFDWDVRTGESRRSSNAEQLLGLDARKAPTAKDFLAQVHRDDRARFKSLVRGVRPNRPSYTTAFRFVRPDGREVWLEETSRAEFDAGGRLARLRGLTLDITERKHGEERQKQLLTELDHRVKNVLARVAAVVDFTRRGSNTMDGFVGSLDGRIQSMAAAHSLLSQSRWQGAAINDLIRQQLAPYATEANLTVGGPDVVLRASATQALAMVLHELVTNAAKYGALSVRDGRVSVTWDRRSNADASASLLLEWRETGAPGCGEPARSGYGTSLIRDLIPHELGGKVDLLFMPEGAWCRIEIPL